MGNKLCKKKSDVVDNAQNPNNNNSRSPSKFDRIINRLHLKPATWKSESNLNKKEGNRSKSEERKHGESIFYTKPLSKSSDWTNVDLEVPVKDDDHIHLRNPKLSLIFDNDKGTPTPPPRKQHKTGNFREKIEKMARNGLQAIQGDKNNQTNQVPVEEPLMVKRKINYSCPICDSDEKNHNRDHHQHHDHKTEQKTTRGSPNKNNKDDSIKASKNNKRKKNLSVVSLPNYNDLKLSVADSDPLRKKTGSTNDFNSSRLSLQTPSSKKITSSQSTGKLDSYITRCRSFGSILPQQLKKLMPQKAKPEDITSDDSFGALEDWDLGLIEHYNPKDASLPRPRKPLPQKPSNKDVLSDIESLIVQEEDIKPKKPKPPGRKIESLVKKFHKEVPKNVHAINTNPEVVCLTPPPSPVPEKMEEVSLTDQISVPKQESAPKVLPVAKTKKVADTKETKVASESILQSNKTENDNGSVEHSSLMRILQEFSVKDKQQEKTPNVENDSEFSSLTPSLVEFEKTLNTNLVEDFINAEQNHTRAVLS